MLLNEKKELLVCPKLQPIFEGPMVVTKKINDWDLEIQLNKTGKKKVVHHDKLKLYKGNQIPKWVKVLADKVISKIR